MSRSVVYIAHPLSGDWEGNIADTKLYIGRAIANGYLPIAPYVMYNGILIEPQDRDLGLELDLEFISVCDEIWLCGDRISNGMKVELDFALEQGLKVVNVPSIEEVPFE